MNRFRLSSINEIIKNLNFLKKRFSLSHNNKINKFNKLTFKIIKLYLKKKKGKKILNKLKKKDKKLIMTCLGIRLIKNNNNKFRILNNKNKLQIKN